MALKMILAGAHAGPEERLRFLHEAEAQARLQHPNIVGVHDVGSRGDHCYLALEFIDGPSLAQRCGGLPQPVEWSARTAEVLARAVHHAHEQGVVHRDLKPGNVLLTAGGVPKVSDFGLARRLEGGPGLTASRAAVGTPSYMAPEQARDRSREAGPAADVWALGAILYELLTGRPPFLAATELETLHKVTFEEAVPPGRLRHRLPRDLQTICLKCLQKEPEKRYRTAAELAEDLRRFREGESIRARPVGLAERGWRWCRRHPGVAGLTALVAFTLAAGSVASGSFAYQQSVTAGQEKQARLLAVEKEKQRQEQLQMARTHLLNAQLARVDALYQREPMRALGLLDDTNACPLDLRDVSWRYYERVCDRRLHFVLRGHKEGVSSISFSPDDQTLASGDEDGTIRLWEAATGRERGTYQGHSRGVTSVAFGPDGRTLASGGLDGKVLLWDVAGGRERASFREPKRKITSVAFSPDGQVIASGGFDTVIRLWDTTGGRKRSALSGHTGWVMGLAFSPDGQTLASGSADDSVRLWDVTTGRCLATLRDHANKVDCVAFSPDGTVLASGSYDGTIKLWDVASRHLRATLRGHRGAVLCLAFSADGQVVASGGVDTAVKLWDLGGARGLAWLDGHDEPISGAQFSPDGKRLVTSDAGHVSRVWDLRTGQVVDEKPLEDLRPGPVSPDSRLRAEINGTFIRLLDLTWTPPLLPPRPKPGEPDPDWHLDQAELAEKEEQWFAAGFHLGKFSDLRPWDAELRLREATAWANAGEKERAALAFLAAVLTGPDSPAHQPER